MKNLSKSLTRSGTVGAEAAELKGSNTMILNEVQVKEGGNGSVGDTKAKEMPLL
jgi:hypothetical protein